MTDMAQDEDDGVRELKPVQFFGNNEGGAFGVDKGMDFRPGVTKTQDEGDDVAGEITHTFQAEPGEPGVPEQADDAGGGDDDEPEFEEEPMRLLDDAPPVADAAEESEPAADAEGAPTDLEVPATEE